MTRTLLLRIASVISLLFAAGHTLGGLKKWSPMGDNEVRALFSGVLLTALVAAYVVAH